jgi:hypothetical protein
VIIEVSQNERNDNGNIDILANEIESWKNFRYALREENALLFNKMLSECGQNKDYIRAAVFKGENCSAESLFMLLTHTRVSVGESLYNSIPHTLPLWICPTTYLIRILCILAR